MQLTSENQQKLQIAVLVYSIRLSFLYLIRGVCKGFFFPLSLYCPLECCQEKEEFRHRRRA
jgi:hypothetical protein